MRHFFLTRPLTKPPVLVLLAILVVTLVVAGFRLGFSSVAGHSATGPAIDSVNVDAGSHAAVSADVVSDDGVKAIPLVLRSEQP